MTSAKAAPATRRAVMPAPDDGMTMFPRFAAGAVGFHPWLLLSMLGERQIRFSADCARAMFQGLETVGRIQEQVARQAVTRHERVAALSRQAADPASLAMLPWILLLADVDAASHLWQALMHETLEQATFLQGRVTRHLADEQQVGVALLPQLAQSPSARHPEGRAPR